MAHVRGRPRTSHIPPTLPFRTTTITYPPTHHTAMGWTDGTAREQFKLRNPHWIWMMGPWTEHVLVVGQCSLGGACLI